MHTRQRALVDITSQSSHLIVSLTYKQHYLLANDIEPYPTSIVDDRSKWPPDSLRCRRENIVVAHVCLHDNNSTTSSDASEDIFQSVKLVLGRPSISQFWQQFNIRWKCHNHKRSLQYCQQSARCVRVRTHVSTRTAFAD